MLLSSLCKDSRDQADSSFPTLNHIHMILVSGSASRQPSLRHCLPKLTGTYNSLNTVAGNLLKSYLWEGRPQQRSLKKPKIFSQDWKMGA